MRTFVLHPCLAGPNACARAILSLALLAVATDAHAQEAVLEGQVVDQQNSALVGVTVELNAPGLAGLVVITTDQRGEYRFASLSPAIYTLTFTLSGFQPEQREVTLGSGEQRAVGVDLGLAPFAQQVDVVGVSPLLGAPVDRKIVAASVFVIASDEARRPRRGVHQQRAKRAPRCHRPRRHHDKRLPTNPAVSRLHGLTLARPSAGHRGLSERSPHQRAVR